MRQFSSSILITTSKNLRSPDGRKFQHATNEIVRATDPIRRIGAYQSPSNALQYTRMWYVLSPLSRKLPSTPHCEHIGVGTRLIFLRLQSKQPWIISIGRDEKRPLFETCQANCSLVQKERVIASNCNRWLQKKSTSLSSVTNERKSELLTPDERSLVSGYPTWGGRLASEINLTKPDKTK